MSAGHIAADVLLSTALTVPLLHAPIRGSVKDHLGDGNYIQRYPRDCLNDEGQTCIPNNRP
jgi:hypothetical protein